MQGQYPQFAYSAYLPLAPTNSELTSTHMGRKVMSVGADVMSAPSHNLNMNLGTNRSPASTTSHQQLQQPPAIIPTKGSLFVGDISFFCTEADLVRLFEPYGRVLHVEVRRNATGESLRHGFAELASVDAAQRAINDLHSSKYMGRRIRVHWACVHVDKRQPRDRSSWTQIYVSFCAMRRERIVTESLLDEIFSRFGAVADVTVKKHSLVASSQSSSSTSVASSPMSLFSSSGSSPTSHASTTNYHPLIQQHHQLLQQQQQQPQPVWTGYAFVYFYDRHDAEHAAQALRNLEADDLRLTYSLSMRGAHACPSHPTDNLYPALRSNNATNNANFVSKPVAGAEENYLHMLRPAKLSLQSPSYPALSASVASYPFAAGGPVMATSSNNNNVIGNAMWTQQPPQQSFVLDNIDGANTNNGVFPISGPPSMGPNLW